MALTIDFLVLAVSLIGWFFLGKTKTSTYGGLGYYFFHFWAPIFMEE